MCSDVARHIRHLPSICRWSSRWRETQELCELRKCANIGGTVSAIPALIQRFLQRLDHRQASSPRSEITPSVSKPLPALSDIATAEAPTGALCARCRHALRRNGHKVRAGRTRARAAQREERVRFLGKG